MLRTDHSDARVLCLQLALGGDRNFSYLIAERSSGRGAAVDPGFAPDQLAAIAAERGVRVESILITHGHADHTAGAARLQALTRAAIRAGSGDRVAGAEPVADGESIPLGALPVEALATPGHSPGHTCYSFEGRLFTGDLLFCGKIGGTGPSFPGSSAEAEWASLQRLLALPDETVVFPGHDFYGGEGAMAYSSIGHERAHNPFLRCADLAAFRKLKAEWPEYKRLHGIR